MIDRLGSPETDLQESVLIRCEIEKRKEPKASKKICH